MEAAHGTPGEARTDLLCRLDNTFSVTDACTGCGTCVKICPVGNIVLSNGRPEWLHHCANCIACYSYCPNKAIRSTMIKTGYYYRQPDFSPIKARTDA
jgi:MinD superfamily P-loop ATPase